MQTKEKKKYVKYLMALGHFCADFTQGTLSAVLPFLIASYHYNYATAASLVMVSNLIGSIIQPVFGVIADRVDRPHLMTAGAVLAGVGMAAVGFIPNFAGLCIAVVISGIGVAMIHPQGARMVNRMADESNVGLSMGIFSFGGNAGFTLGPVCAAGAVTLFGLKGTLIILIPALLFSVFMILFYRGYEGEQILAPHNEEAAGEKKKDRWGSFVWLGILVMARSVIFSGISTFLILYMIDMFGFGESSGSALLSLFYAVGAICSIAGGRLADVKGLKKILVISNCILAASVVAFSLTDSLVLAAVLAAVLGVGTNLGYASMVALGQLYLPNHVGLASGVTLGLSVSIGGILAPVLGRVGDVMGLHAVFMILAGISFIPVIIALTVPSK